MVYRGCQKNVPIEDRFSATNPYTAIIFSEHYYDKRYKLCLHIYIKHGSRENAESNYQIPGKQTLESLDPGLLEPFLPTNWEKIQNCLAAERLSPAMRHSMFEAANGVNDAKIQA